ncbi:DNA polymerase III subunit delta' [Velocimicrobium porci]|uniref:DNA polymerase III subunit delta n=1 Tax=Velocimicrobium porci TaxID=2606634 RepID=A0A6L5Y1M0_9FIRM|nr:DNA polymerase III subunit delta' [Velocimicrobium porci]MSS64809.1 DNA polymerase III subunit delta' [Velocimicrobium porci]
MLYFNSIIGHEQIKQHLQTAIEQKKVSHAYILNGEQGMGKKLLATVFAETLQCEDKGVNPCGLCKSCIQTESKNHPDIRWITHEKYSIGVDDIRTQINNDIEIKPYSGPYKIYIIPDAEKMTEQAQNALLKTIEEPPEYAVILLLTENVDYMLQTILSRCIILNLKPVKQSMIEKYLMERCSVPDYVAKLSAAFSQGNVGKAIRYSTASDFLEMREDTLHLLKYIDEMEFYEVVEAIKKLSEHKLEINDCLDLMQLWYRDILMFKVTKDPNTLLFKEEYRFIVEQAKVRSYEGIEMIIKAINKAKQRLKANVNFEIAIELMLLTIKECRND